MPSALPTPCVAEFKVVGPDGTAQRRLFKWTLPKDATLETALKVSRQRAVDQGLTVRSVNFQVADDGVSVGGILVYVKES